MTTRPATRGLAIAALLLAAIGLYGLLAFTLANVAARCLRLVAIGLAVGVVSAYGAAGAVGSPNPCGPIPESHLR